MPDYNLHDIKAVGFVDVQFTPLTTPLVAWYAWIDEDNDDKEELAKRPVLGVLLRHGVNAEGEVISSRVELAVQYEDTAELCAADDSALIGQNETFVGAYPADAEVPASTLSSAYKTLRAELTRSKSP